MGNEIPYYALVPRSSGVSKTKDTAEEMYRVEKEGGVGQRENFWEEIEEETGILFVCLFCFCLLRGVSHHQYNSREYGSRDFGLKGRGNVTLTKCKAFV